MMSDGVGIKPPCSTRQELTMKHIDIYLTKEQKQELDKISQKYQVSLSVIVDKVAHRYFQLFVMKGQDPFKTMTEKYIYNEKGYRTSVKPKYYKDFIKSYEPVIKIKGWQSKLFTNLIKIWLKNNEYRWIDEKDIINKFRNMINSDLQKTYDQYWNYNEQIRNTRRMIKENKDYWKRALEEA